MVEAMQGEASRGPAPLVRMALAGPRVFSVLFSVRYAANGSQWQPMLAALCAWIWTVQAARPVTLNAQLNSTVDISAAQVPKQTAVNPKYTLTAVR